MLTVDDNKINIIVATKFLKRESIESDTAVDGLLAVEQVTTALLSNRPYDIIFLDIHVSQSSRPPIGSRRRDPNLPSSTYIMLTMILRCPAWTASWRPR